MATSSNCSARTPITTPSCAKKKPTRKSAGIRTRMWSTGRSTKNDAAVKVSTATSKPRMKPPSEKASSSSSGEAGDQKDHVVDSVQLVDPRAERGSEHGDIEERLEQRRPDRLLLDLHEAV